MSIQNPVHTNDSSVGARAKTLRDKVSLCLRVIGPGPSDTCVNAKKWTWLTYLNKNFGSCKTSFTMQAAMCRRKNPNIAGEASDSKALKAEKGKLKPVGELGVFNNNSLHTSFLHTWSYFPPSLFSNVLQNGKYMYKFSYSRKRATTTDTHNSLQHLKCTSWWEYETNNLGWNNRGVHANLKIKK